MNDKSDTSFVTTMSGKPLMYKELGERWWVFERQNSDWVPIRRVDAQEVNKYRTSAIHQSQIDLIES